MKMLVLINKGDQIEDFINVTQIEKVSRNGEWCYVYTKSGMHGITRPVYDELIREHGMTGESSGINLPPESKLPNVQESRTRKDSKSR